jgi:hypothetical protein
MRLAKLCERSQTRDPILHHATTQSISKDRRPDPMPSEARKYWSGPLSLNLRKARVEPPTEVMAVFGCRELSVLGTGSERPSTANSAGDRLDDTYRRGLELRDGASSSLLVSRGGLGFDSTARWFQKLQASSVWALCERAGGRLVHDTSSPAYSRLDPERGLPSRAVVGKRKRSIACMTQSQHTGVRSSQLAPLALSNRLRAELHYMCRLIRTDPARDSRNLPGCRLSFQVGRDGR